MASNEWYEENEQDYFEDEGDSQLEEGGDNDYAQEQGEDYDYDGEGEVYDYYEQDEYYDYYEQDDDYTITETYEAATEDSSNRDFMTGGSDGLNEQATTADVNYTSYVYFIIAGMILGGFIVAVVMRKRVSTKQQTVCHMESLLTLIALSLQNQLNDGELGEDLNPDGEQDLKGSVQRHMADLEAGGAASASSSRLPRRGKRPRKGRSRRFGF
jgi:hypothetical protein